MPAHRAIALAFLGPPPEGKSEINHKNGVRDDNRLENLEWVSRSENQLHRYRVLKHNRGEDRPLAKLREDDVRIIRASYRKGERGHTLRALAERFGVAPSVIRQVLSGRTWRFVQ